MTGGKLVVSLKVQCGGGFCPRAHFPCVNLCVKSSPNLAKMGEIDQNVLGVRVCARCLV